MPARKTAPQVGVRLIREWNGKTNVVDVVEKGFHYESDIRLAVGHCPQDHRRALVRTKVLRPMSALVKLRCAVYTRKSSEEGLDQEFNSLDAQREACVAFIASQVGLGWKLVDDRYDDGGISGGTLERPGLQRLLHDIQANRVDVVVVYKIDRLTRSLMDFSKIVEIFDASQVSFVSVTQQFNTTTSMGRLTLNVLLSFAQFEREVTAERIRDKIAASKKKGLWMGGHVPLGYRVLDRKLLIHDAEAQSVRNIFNRYLELKSVLLLTEEINSQGELGSSATGDRQVPHQNRQFTRGKLYYLLSNQVYIGKLRHHERFFDGEHPPIIDQQTFAEVQSLLANQAQRRKGSSDTADTHLLTGILFDDTGDRLSPTHATKAGKRYRYYISNRLKIARSKDDGGWRVPAQAVEDVVDRQVQRILRDQKMLSIWLEKHAKIEDIKSALDAATALAKRLTSGVSCAEKTQLLKLLFQRITLKPDRISFEIKRRALISRLLGKPTAEPDDKSSDLGDSVCVDNRAEDNKTESAASTLDLPIAIKRRGVEVRLVIGNGQSNQHIPDQTLCDLIGKAHLYLAKLTDGANRNVADVAKLCGAHRADVSRILPLAFLAPSLVEKILSGQQPADLSARTLARFDLPLAWNEQETGLNF